MILATASSGFNSQYLILGLSIVVILSYFFNIISHRFNIPSVILLIALGIGIEYGLKGLGVQFDEAYEFVFLEVVGIIGLIMIVLEAALDLKLKQEKKGILVRSFLIALLVFLISSASLAGLLYYMLGLDYVTAMVYAVPLSIMSSAIIIPSVANLSQDKKEFMIYESTFSDIIGIMAFYMFLDGIRASGNGAGAWPIISDLTLTTVLTTLISLVISYLMVILFQNIKGHGKLVLMVCILMFLYALGKINHLSPLLLILLFGLILNNKGVFFRGPLKSFVKEDDALSHVLLDEFKVVTIEASFFVRTVFFVLFGMSIALDALWDPLVLTMTGMVLAVLYIVRYIHLKVMTRTSIYPELFIAPRGLITILLFYAIPESMRSEQFDTGILLLTIIGTSLIMMLSLMLSGRGEMVDQIEDAIISHPNAMEALSGSHEHQTGNDMFAENLNEE